MKTSQRTGYVRKILYTENFCVNRKTILILGIRETINKLFKENLLAIPLPIYN